LGSRPTGPTESEDFIVANTTFLSLRLDLWRDNRCDILYFVVEYKHDSSDVWTTGESRSFDYYKRKKFQL
jgi:hypothetical protein